MNHYLILKSFRNNERFLGILPGYTFINVGDLVVYVNAKGEERIGVVSVPDFTGETGAVEQEWGKPVQVLARLMRSDFDWPVDMDEKLPEIEE